MPVIGTGILNQSCAHAAHGPIVHTNALHATDSPSTVTAPTLTPASDDGSASVSRPSTLPMRSDAPPATAASTSFVHSSSGATCAPPSLSIHRLSARSPSSHGQMSFVFFVRLPGVTESTGILR